MSLDFRGIHLQVIEDESSEIDLEGARYSGKTWALCAKVLLSADEHPGMEWLICRYSDDATRTKLRPELERIAGFYGIPLHWNEDQKYYALPEKDGKVSRIYAYGLKSQSIRETLSKVRGLGVAAIWNDQTEEMPQEITEELRFGARQPGYPHQVIFSPNPPPEDHFLCDQFPEENPFPHRKYYRVSLYDNAHNLQPGKIEELEALYPPTHVKHKSLILGMRGPNVVGVPVYNELFDRAGHVVDVRFDPMTQLYEAIHTGGHHPVWVASQRTPYGFNVLGGVMGKRMFLEDFLPVVDYYRREWFDRNAADFKLCCDAPPSEDEGMSRFTHVSILRDAGLAPKWRKNSAAPDVRDAVIQHVGGLMRRRNAALPAFCVAGDPQRFMMVSSKVTKQTKLFVDGLEASYVWDDNFISVGSKKVRQPKMDQWVDGWQRCLENTVLNFSTVKTPPRPTMSAGFGRPPTGDGGWMVR